MPGSIPDSPIEHPDEIRRATVALLRRMAAVEPREFLPDVLRQQLWDKHAREEDAKISRCDRCGEWTYEYAVCRACRTRHQRRHRAA